MKMQTIEETLAEYIKAFDKLDDADRAFNAAKFKMLETLHSNTEPFKLNDQNGKYTGITIKTPEDVRDMVAGSIIVIGGVAWMLRNDGWVSGYGGDDTHEGMFVRILRHRENTHLIYKPY